MAQKISGDVVVDHGDFVVDSSSNPYEKGYKFNTIPFGGMTIDAKNAVRIGSAADVKLVPPSGYVVIIGTTGSLPTASASLRGGLFITLGSSGVADSINWCIKSAADTYSWQGFTLLVPSTTDKGVPRFSGNAGAQQTSDLTISDVASNIVTVATIGADTIKHTANIANSSSAISHIFDNTTDLSTAGALLMSVRTAGVEKFSVSQAGTGIASNFRGTGVTAVKTANYTATATDELIPASISGGAWTLTLPAASAGKGQRIRVKLTTIHATNRLTVSRAGSDTIKTINASAATTFSAGSATTFDTFELQSDGTSVWYMTHFNGSTVP